ncbi:MAG: S-layer family protein, partial [Rhodospirillales bacterium]|nr:S-layer family protein [Rhodospirillales bacterium]
NANGHSASSIITEGAVSFANAMLSLDSTGGITQTGTLTGTTLDFNAASMALNGLVNASLLNLSASSAITQATSGALNTATLSGSGSNILLGGANTISTLNALSATSTINLQDTAALNVNGAVSAGSSLALSAPGLTLANTLSAGHINLAADSITDNGGAVNAAGGIVSIAPRTTGLAVDLGGNAAGLDLSGTLLGAIHAAALDISTAGSIIADGSASIAATLLSLSGTGITFAGTLDVPGTLALASGAGVTATSANHLTAGSLLAGGAIAGSVNLSQGSNSIGTLGSLTLNGGSLTLADATALAVNGPISASAVGLTGTSITLNAPVRTGTLTLAASNGVNETGGGLSVTTLTGSVSGNAILNGGANNISTLANFTDNGALTLADNVALTQAGSLAATNATFSAAGLNFTGNVTTPGTLEVGSSNGVSQSGGTINAAVLSSTGAVNGNIVMTQAGDKFPDVQNLAATGTIDLASSIGLSQTGQLSASAVTFTAPSFALNGTLSASGALQLNGGGASEGAGGVIDAALLTTGGRALAGDAVFNNGANNIAALGNFNANGGLTLADGEALAISGPVSLSGTLALVDSGNITQTAGSITAAALTSDGGTIGGSATFGQAGNAIPVLGAFATRGNLLLNTSAALTVAGNVNTGGTLSLDSGGAISQSNGVLTAARFNASGTNIDLSGTNIGTLGDVTAASNVNIANVGGLAGTLTAQNATLGSNGGFTASGSARIADALYLTAAGAVNQTRGNISAATATITAPSITLSGTTNIRNELNLRARGNIIHESGALNAGTLSGTAGQLAEFGGATDIGTLGSFMMADSVFMLTNDAPLTIIGPVVANAVSITAAGAMILDGSAGGGLYLSGSTITGTPLQPRNGVDSILAVTGGEPSITQIGTFNVDAGPNAAKYLGNANPQATLFMSLANSGNIALAPAPGVLAAPNTDLVLAAGTGGAVSGNISVLRLLVLSAQSVEMTGSIGSVTGPTAAGKGTAFPFPQPGYRFNTCPIGSVNCTILPIEGLPQANPLENFNLSPRKRRRLDKNVTLPGIAARDF